MSAKTEVLATRTAFVMSDSTGETADRVLQVVLEQFPGINVRDQRVPNVKSPAMIADVMHAAHDVGAFVIYTIADPHLRATAHTAASELGVQTLDLFGALLPPLGAWLDMKPVGKPGHPYDEKYFRRLDAIRFTQRHDDGKLPHELHLADVVVLGLSRVSKTPVCKMLAEHRISAANVPIVPVVPLPDDLNRVDPRRVYVIHKDVRRLVEVRKTRFSEDDGKAEFGSYTGDYTDVGCVRDEVNHVLKLLASHSDWTRIDLTRRNVEDAASLILAEHRKRFPES